MDYTAFSHGQIQSKLWLCEHLEPVIPHYAHVAIIGSWYNILGNMLLTRNPKKYNSIIGIDADPSAIAIANKLSEAWRIHPDCKIENRLANANTFDYHGRNVVINCSIENIQGTNWFGNIKANALVCLQTAIVKDEQVKKDWNVVTECDSMDNFISTFPMHQILYTGEKDFEYGNLVYKRLMLIGIK